MKNYLQTNRPFGLGFFDNVFEDFFVPTFTGVNKSMHTDIKETETGYELSVDMPGYEKEDIKLTLEKGYLTVEATRKESTEQKYLRQERSISCKRSYYVGENLTEEDVKAKYINGTLSLDVPKKEAKIPEKKTIEIE